MPPLHVVLVAHDEDMAVAAATALFQAGFEVHVARTAAAAIRLLVDVDDLRAILIERTATLEWLVLHAVAGDRDLLELPVILLGRDGDELPAGVWASIPRSAIGRDLVRTLKQVCAH